VTERPLHLVNEALVLTGEPLPENASVDLALSAGRIEERHGTAAGARYRHFLGRALEVEPGVGRDDLLTLAALAAWRSGALAFRTDALRRLDRALAAGSPALPALAAALGLGDGGVAPFARLQSNSRFGWPGLHAPGELLAVIGGFRGLFGPWLAAPIAVLPGERPGTFLIRTSARGPGAQPDTQPDTQPDLGADSTADTSVEDWLLTVDVFGHTLVRLTADEEGTGDTARAAEAARWSAAGDTATGPAEAGAAGAAGAVLRVHGYTAELRVAE
jgi:hypothetical protein